MLTLFLAILITFAVTAIVMYFKLIVPMRWRLRCIKQENEFLRIELENELLRIQLVEHQRILKDIQKWVEIETASKPEIGKALKQRIAERLEE